MYFFLPSFRENISWQPSIDVMILEFCVHWSGAMQCMDTETCRIVTDVTLCYLPYCKYSTSDSLVENYVEISTKRFHLLLFKRVSVIVSEDFSILVTMRQQPVVILRKECYFNAPEVNFLFIFINSLKQGECPVICFTGGSEASESNFQTTLNTDENISIANVIDDG